jgi:tetratricopeptide (TPR) repeat protein
MGKPARGAWKSRLMVFVTAILFLAIPYSRAIAQQAPEKTIPVSQMTAQQLETRGDAFRSQKDPISALDSYNKAISKNPRNAVLWNKVGMIQLQLGASSQGADRLRRYAEARHDFERAVKLKKDYAEAVNNLGVIYYQQGDYKKAISLYKRALSIRPTASFHSNLGSVYFAQKKFEDATKEYLEALRLDPDVFERSSATGILGRVSTPADRAKYAIMLAKLYAQLGDVDHALVQIRTALENGYSELEPLYQDSEFANVRKDPRFAELMQNKPAALPE